MDVGVPVYFVNASSSTTSATSGSGVGNPFVDLRWKYLRPAVNLASVVTGSAPLGDSKLGLSTGRATFDWTNRFDRSFSQLKPFLEAGFSNTASDSRLFVRPYTTLGLNTHFRGGAEFDIWKSISVGGAAYDILPFGNQTVFSRVSKVPTGNGAHLTAGIFRSASKLQELRTSLATMVFPPGWTPVLRHISMPNWDTHAAFTTI